MQFIYKVMPQDAWRAFQAEGRYSGSADDQRDGFIHFSTGVQLPGTLAKHYPRQTGLMLLQLDADALGAALKWEPSRGGDLFPHLYGGLALAQVREAWVLPDDHQLPEGV